MNYLEYKKNFDPNVHVQVFKVTIKVNGEMVDEEIANLFKFTLRDNAFNWCNNYMWDNPNYKFANLEQALCRCYQKVQNDEQVYLQLNNLKQESIERIEVSCETLLKLLNSL